jgi:hypothetical protein
LKRKGEELMRTNPKSDRLQPYKSQYMRLCKLFVDAMKDHQRSKASDAPDGWRRQPRASFPIDSTAHGRVFLPLCAHHPPAVSAPVSSRPQEQMRKLQLDTVVRRAQIAYGGTKSEAELREVRAPAPTVVSSARRRA